MRNKEEVLNQEEKEQIKVSSDKRSSSVALRATSDVKGIKHGLLRLLEHDKFATSSSNSTDYRAKFSLLDDPTLEIN